MFTVINTVLAPIKVGANKINEYITKGHNSLINNIPENGLEKDPERIFEKKSKMEQFKSLFFSDPIHIIDNIYLGNAMHAALYYKLEKFKIKHIFNVTTEISNFYEEKYEYTRFPLFDNGIDKITKYLNPSYEKLIELNNKKKNTLVHCYMGASRSVSIIIYYLMVKHNMTFDEAVMFMKNKKDTINVSKRFKKDILKKIKENKIKRLKIEV